MRRASIVPIVEGHGEQDAVPLLIRRIAGEIDPALVVDIPSPIRVHRHRVVKPGEMERVVELAARRVAGRGAILVLLDSDDDCPAALGPELLRRAQQERGDVPIGVVLAKHEFEAWFLAAAESIRACKKVRSDIQPPDQPPEDYRSAKGWLEKRMTHGVYKSTVDMASLAAQFDLATARSAPSFDRCYRIVANLLSDSLGKA